MAKKGTRNLPQRQGWPKGETPPHLRGREWKKGEPSPNPNGAPPGPFFSTLLNTELDMLLSEERRRPKDRTKRQEIARMLVEKATEGSIAHAREVMDRVEGKVADKVNVGGSEEAMRILVEHVKATSGRSDTDS